MTPHQGQFILHLIQDHTQQILPRVHLPITSIEILIHPSGLTGMVPLGDAHLSTLMRAPLHRNGVVGELGGTEKGEERERWTGKP